MNIRSLLPIGFLCIVPCACGSAPPKPVASPTVAATPPPPRSASVEKSPDRAVVQIAEDIRKACGVSDDDAYFAFDSSRLTQREHDVLHKVAVCFESGPLSGRSMHVVGHADPRGTDEYNLVLGGARADAVKNYLHREGLSDGKIATTSRGDMDASGKDEAGWAKDRRVDILLSN